MECPECASFMDIFNAEDNRDGIQEDTFYCEECKTYWVYEVIYRFKESYK